MRKFFLTLALLLASFGSVRAQAEVTLATLDVQVWPDYDAAEVLVIYDFSAAEGVSLPAQMTLPLPQGARLLAVARSEAGALMNVDGWKTNPDGSVTLSLSDRSIYHIEYYYPYSLSGTERRFTFSLPGGYAVNAATLRVQEPVGAQGMSISPALQRVGPEPDGFSYFTASLGSFASGKAPSFEISYDNPENRLSADSLGVQPTAPLDEPVSGQSSLMTVIPWVLGTLGVLLIVGGGVWYWLSGRSSSSASRVERRRHSGGAEPAGQAYCAQCGKRAQAGDRFCRACGAKIRAN